MSLRQSGWLSIPTPAARNPGLVNGKIYPSPKGSGYRDLSFISDLPFKEQSLTMASPDTLSIIDTGGLGALYPSIRGHNSSQHIQPGLGSISELWFGASCPVSATLASRALTKRRLCLEEITLQQSSHTHKSTKVWLPTLECTGSSCVCLEGLSILPRSFCLSKMPHNTGTRMEKRILGFSSIPTPSTSQPRKHLWTKWPFPAG